MTRHERDIDSLLEQAKNDCYNSVLRLGSRGLLCAREIVATAAVRGQAQLVQQLQRSYSLNDVNEETVAPGNDGADVIVVTQRRRMRIEEIDEDDDGNDNVDRGHAWHLTAEEDDVQETDHQRRSNRRSKSNSQVDETTYATMPRTTRAANRRRTEL